MKNITHNIVAQFSFSVYTAKDNEKNRIPVGKHQGDFKDYQVINGSIFSEEYNETLDSATILLSQIKKEDRLIYIQPYEYVRIFDKSTFNILTGKYDFDNLYLVDDFEETENNINEHIFGYSINLMSETKLLEKIQCPNCTTTHELDEDGRVVKKTIYEYIDQYMKLYVPKMKYSSDGETWEYKYLISWPKGKETIATEGTSVVSFDDSILERHEHGGAVWYTLDLELPAEDVAADEYSTVIMEDWFTSCEDLYDATMEYNEETGKFIFHALTNNPNSTGDVVVEFTYEKVVVVETDFFKRFNVPCADLSFTAPTLRQLLTMLMQQVGCIPIVKNRKLSFLDFQIDAVPFGGEKGYTINNTVNKIRRSLSSDSFVNTLVNISENVLDSENEVVCESLGFRDRTNALIKQQENLFLETKFPIYKINECKINAYVKSKTVIRAIQSSMQVGVPGYEEEIRWLLSFSKPDDSHVSLSFNTSIDPHGLVTITGEIVAFKYDYEEIQTIRNINLVFRGDTYQPGIDDVVTAELIDDSFDMFYFNGFIRVEDINQTYEYFKYSVFFPSFDSINRLTENLVTLYTQDITKLILENSIRQNLSTNFEDMCEKTRAIYNPTLDTLSKYVYGTIGYDIGSKKISGFSQTFVKGSVSPTGWISAEYTYIENIWNFITTYYQEEIKSKILKDFANMPIVEDLIWHGDDPNPVGSPTEQSIEIQSISGYNPWDTGNLFPFIKNLLFISDLNFVTMWFDIKYQPLNSFNMAYVKSKESVDFLLQQYDGNASGLTDFDRLSIHEQEQVDRIGNEVLTISQRTNDSRDIQDFLKGPLSFKDDSNRDGSINESDKGTDYIIFKRTYSIENNCLNASYVGSKDSILKDFFTSIRTKYRAYQYVDFSQSVLRKERDTFFVKISEDGWYNGDDKVFFGELAQENASLNNQRKKLSWLIPSNEYENDDKYIFSETYVTISKDNSVFAKNDVSKVSFDNFIGFVYEEYDNVSAGSYIPEYAYSQTLWSLVFNSGNDDSGNAIGGVPQKWQIWDKGFFKSHKVGFYQKLDLNQIFNTFIGDIDDSTRAEINEDLQKVFQLPIVDRNLLENKAVFHIVDDNTDIDKSRKTFFKDGAERINHTIQFIYYTDSENIIWNEDFLAARFSGLPIATSGYVASDRRIVDLTGEEFILKKGEYFSEDNPLFVSMSAVEYVVPNNSNPYICVHWDLIPNGITEFKIVEVRTLGLNNHYIRDIIAFRRSDSESDEQKFYITLNDTKSDYVMAERDGVLFRRYKVRQNTSERLVDKIHDL